MNAKDFSTVVNRRLSLVEAVLALKGLEYTVDGEDRFHNFNRAAAMLGVTREKALLGMLAKHIVSVLDMIDATPKAPPSIAFIEEKCGDAINYLIILEGMLKERLRSARVED
jgi:hypothetical protein